MAAPPAARETGDEATRGREHQEDRERVREREARSARPDQQRARACARDSGPRAHVTRGPALLCVATSRREYVLGAQMQLLGARIPEDRSAPPAPHAPRRAPPPGRTATLSCRSQHNRDAELA